MLKKINKNKIIIIIRLKLNIQRFFNFLFQMTLFLNIGSYEG